MLQPEKRSEPHLPLKVSRDRLLVRPNSMAGEHEIGYLLRLAHLNGLHTHRILETPASSIEMRQGHGRAKWCPRCLEQPAAIWMADWDKSFAICSVHQCWLVDQCAGCKRDAKWVRMKMFTCQCGHPLTDSAARVLSPELAWLLGDRAPEHSAGQSWVMLTRDERLLLLRFVGALDVHGLTGKPLKRASRGSVDAERQLVEAGAAIVSGQERVIFALLDRIRTMSARSCAVQTMNEAFPRLTTLIAHLPSRATRGWINEHLTNYVEYARTAQNALTWRRNDARRPGSARDCGQQIRMRPADVATVCSQFGIEPSVRLTKTGRRILVLTNEDVEKVHQRMRDLVSHKTVATRTGISVKRQRQLLVAGLVKSVRGRIDASSVSRLLTRLSQAASTGTHTKSDDWVSLYVALRFRVPVDQTTEFFAAILDGQIAIRVGGAETCSDSRADNIYLPGGQVDAWRERLSPGSARVTIPDGAKRLGIKEQVMYHLVNVGLIGVVSGRCSRRTVRLVELAELDRFRATYEPLALAARRDHVDFRGALAWAKRTGLTIVSGPSLDGGRQYFVLKGKS